MATAAAIEVDDVSFSYGRRQALDHLSLTVRESEIFVLLGPNGSGKTTLFRLLSTLLTPQSGTIHILGKSLGQEVAQIRAAIGVVFQAPSLDPKLTVSENIRCQGALYGVVGEQLRQRERQLLGQLGVEDRSGDRVETLSGGLKRRVELAAGMIHQPRLLILDEPSTGLDPGARSDLWQYLNRLRTDHGVTIVLTTHLLEEAEKADRIAIINEGSLVALDTPDALRATVGGDAITISTAEPESLVQQIGQKFDLVASVVDASVRLELPEGHQWIARLVEAFPQQIESVTLGKPTLEDVFIDKTGHRFWHDKEEKTE